MSDPPDLRRRVTRLENDVESLYELINDFRTETRQGFVTLTQRADAHDDRFDEMDSRLDRMDSRFDRMDSRFDGVESTLAEVLRRLPG